MSTYYDRISGLSAPSGEPYIRIERHGNVVRLPLSAFHYQPREAFDLLKQHRIYVVGADCQALIKTIEAITDFPRESIAETTGWNAGNMFALPDRRVFTADGSADAIAVFPGKDSKVKSSGALNRWRRKVAGQLKGQHIYQFAIMFMFAPPLLDLFGNMENRGVELVGKGKIGKSHVQKLMSSVAGGIGRGREGHYWVRFDTTLTALEPIMEEHRDMPLILDEANLLAQNKTAAQCTTFFKDMAFKLGEGTIKRRWGRDAHAECRLLYFSSSNKSLRQYIGEGDDADAACDRLLTIRVPEERPYGTLDSVPERFANPKAFLDSVVESALRDYGVAMPAFLARLVAERASDEGALKRQIKRYMDEFASRASPAPDDRELVRSTEFFGLVYAAGKKAEEYGVLPSDYNCGKAVKACFHLHLASTQAERPFVERLQAIAQHPGIIDLGSGALKPLTSEQLEFGAFLRDGRDGQELLIIRKRIRHFIPDWSDIKKRPEVVTLMSAEAGKHTRRKKLSSSHDRLQVYTFRLA